MKQDFNNNDEKWDVHQHKDELCVSDAATIFHPEHGQLCWCERHWDYLLFHPIKWNDRAAAYKWINEGCIAEIQEGLSCLAVGFSLTCYEKIGV
jgi:hypothetical protein